MRIGTFKELKQLHHNLKSGQKYEIRIKTIDMQQPESTNSIHRAEKAELLKMLAPMKTDGFYPVNVEIKEL